MASFIGHVLYYILTVTGAIFLPIIKLIFSWIYDGSATKVPPVEDPLLLQSATTLAKKIRTREVKSVQLMEAFINRVSQVNPLVNAIVDERFEGALREAMAVDRLLDSKDPLDEGLSPENAPFLGVPISIKEAFFVTGMSNSSGLVSRKDWKSESDAPVVTNLKRSGAIPFIFTNTSELCMWLESNNRLYGRTKNAYDTARIVGGSSGGEGCIISAGGSVIGIGSDIGGSIRIPSFFNGIFGHKPSPGIVSNEKQFPPVPSEEKEVLLGTGPMCRYAVDLKPMLKVMGGETAKKLNLDLPVTLRSLRIFTMEDDGGSIVISKVEPELKEAQRRVAKHFKESVKCSVTKVCLSKMKYSLELWSGRMSTPGVSSFCELMGGGKGPVNAFWEMAKWLVGMSDHTLPAIGLGMSESISFLVDNSSEKLASMKLALSEEIQQLLGDNGVLFYPSHTRVAPYHNQPLLTPMDFAYTAIFNALELPVTQCPLGLGKEGLPLGIQVVATPNNDRLAIAVAEEIEKQFGGWVTPRQ